MTYISETFRRHSCTVCKLIQNEFIVSVCLSICINLDSGGLSLATCEFLVFTGVNFETSGLVISGATFGKKISFRESRLSSVINNKTRGLKVDPRTQNKFTCHQA